MKNLKKLGTVAMVSLIFLLCGCGRTAAKKDIDWAVGVCANNGGVVSIKGENAALYGSAVCENGAEFTNN